MDKPCIKAHNKNACNDPVPSERDPVKQIIPIEHPQQEEPVDDPGEASPMEEPQEAS